jgi:hypothetical protein
VGEALNIGSFTKVLAHKVAHHEAEKIEDVLFDYDG